MKTARLTILLIILLFAVSSPLLCEVAVSAVETTSFTHQELSAFKQKIVNPDTLQVEVVIYSFSATTEVFYLDEKDRIQMNNEPGFLRCMLTIKKPPDKTETVFVEVSGNDRAQLITDCAKKINAILAASTK